MVKSSLAPGNVLFNNAFGFGGSEWRTALVVAVDQGQLSTKRELNDGRPASILLLLSGPNGTTIKQVSFSWITAGKWERMEEF